MYGVYGLLGLYAGMYGHQLRNLGNLASHGNLGNLDTSENTSLQQLSMSLQNRSSAKLEKPYENMHFVDVNPRHYKKYFLRIRDTLLRLFPNVHSYNGWAKTFESLLQERVDYVYSNATATDAPVNRPRECILLPKCIAELLNSIGIVSVTGNNGKQMTLCPRIPDNCRVRNVFVPSSVEKSQSTSTIVVSSCVKGFMNTGYLTDSIEGTSWWALSARQLNKDSSIATGKEDRIQVYANFTGYTLEDELKCAIVRNQFDGRIPDGGELVPSDAPIHGVVSLQNVFNLKG